MQDYKEAARAILNELLDDVTKATAEKIGDVSEREEGDIRCDLQGPKKDLQGRDLQGPMEEAGSMDVSFSSAPRAGDSEEEDIEDFASAEEDEDIAAITEGLIAPAKLQSPLETNFEDLAAIETCAGVEAETAKSTRKLIQELLDMEVVGQVQTPVTGRVASSYSHLAPVTFPTTEMDLVNLEDVGEAGTPLQAEVAPLRLSRDLTLDVSPSRALASNLNPYPSTPVPSENLTQTSSGLTDLIRRVRVASEVKTPAAPVPPPTSTTFNTTLTPFDLPRLVMDSPPIPAIKLPASPPANSAAIKRHLFDSPMLTAGQTEQAKLEEAVLQPTLVTSAAEPETLMSSATLDKVDQMLDSRNPLTQAWTSPFTLESREGFSMYEEKLLSPPRVKDTFEQPLSSGGGYNLDFLEVLGGTDAQKLCPTSPLVVKRRESLHLLQEKADAEEDIGPKNEASTLTNKSQIEAEESKEVKSILGGNSCGVQGQEEESLRGKRLSLSSHEYDLSQPSCSTSDTNAVFEAHLGFPGGKESPEFDQPISSKGDYNLDFLEEVGTEAANLCPTSPLVIKERKRRPANIEKSAINNSESGVEVEDGNAESSSEGHSSEETQRPRDKEPSSEPPETVDSIDHPLASKGYNIDVSFENLNPKDMDPGMVCNGGGIQNSPVLASKGYNTDFLETEDFNAEDLDPSMVSSKKGGIQNSPLVASKGYNMDFLSSEDFNAEDLDPGMVGSKKGGIQNSPAPADSAPSKAKKLVKPWMRKKAQKTPLPSRKVEEVAMSEIEEVKKDTSPSKPLQMEGIPALKEANSSKYYSSLENCSGPEAPFGVHQEAEPQEVRDVQQTVDQKNKVLESEGAAKDQSEEDMARAIGASSTPTTTSSLKKKPRLIKKSKSVVSFKELTEEIPDSPTHFDPKFELEAEKPESVLDSTITLEEPKIGNLLPGFDLPVISLVEEAQLLEKDKAVALLVEEVEDKQEEEEMLQEELGRSADSNRAMVHVVGEYEKTIEQLVQEKTRQKSVLITKAGEKREETDQVRIEIEEVKRASKDLTKKYSRTREVISGYITTEADLKGEVESLVGRVSECKSFLSFEK